MYKIIWKIYHVNMQKLLIIIGLLFLILGAAYPVIKKLQLGNLPGDIFYSSDKFTFIFPLVSCIVLSLVISILLNIFR